MAVDDVYKVSIRATQFGTDRVNVLYVRCTEEPEPTAAQFATFAVDYKEVHRGQQSNTVGYAGWRAVQVRGTAVTYPGYPNCNPIGGKFFEGNFSGSTAGGLTGDALPPQCALVTTLRTGLTGRSRRGRVYGYGFPEGEATGGVWNSNFLTFIATGWTTFMTKYAPPTSPINLQLGVWSTQIATGCKAGPNGKGHAQAGTPNPAQAFAPVSSYLNRTTVYTQRRRVGGVGS